jgi:hypothetical protein
MLKKEHQGIKQRKQLTEKSYNNGTKSTGTFPSRIYNTYTEATIHLLKTIQPNTTIHTYSFCTMTQTINLCLFRSHLRPVAAEVTRFFQRFPS